MAERTFLGIWILLSLYQTYAALDVFAPSPQRALFTTDTILICTFSVDKQPPDLNFLVVSWIFQGRVILKYDSKGFSTQDPRMSLSVESLEYGYASLYVSNVNISDRGTYKCIVKYSTESKEKEISFKVFARPLLSIQSTKIQRNTENTLTCKVTGFFPSDILITWYRNGEVLRNLFMGKPQMYNNGTYHVDSNMTITPTNDDQNQTFSCSVLHESLQEPLQKDFQLVFEDIETSSNAVTVVCIILVLMTLLAVGIGIFLWRRKYRKKGVFTVMDIEGPTKLISGEETSLYCKATNCPENTSVTWLEKRGGQVCEIPEYNGGDMEEEERLMDTQYWVLSCREGPNFTSSLKFRPSVAKDVTFICRYSCGKWKKEKKFHCRAIYAKPQLVQPVSRSLIVSEALKYLVTLENFYPRDITIRWTHGVGESQQVLPSTETFTEIPDGTYHVCSEVTIPEELLKDPEFRVRVSWEHESLDTPGYKDLSIRDSDLPWRPQVGEIIIPNLEEGKEVRLTCDISGYFPDHLKVSWCKKEPGTDSHPIVTELHKDDYKVYDQKEQKDKTFSNKSSLTFTPSFRRDQGAEFICKVEHPILEHPIERRTGPIRIDLPRPQVGEIKIPQLEEDKKATLTCDISECFPHYTTVSWYRKLTGTDLHPIITPLPNDDFQVCTEIKDKIKSSLTFTASLDTIKSSLTFTPSFRRDQGSELICRVEHPSLEEPIEKTAGPIRIDLPHPQIGKINIPKLEEDKKATLTCNIYGYIQDYTTVSWYRKLTGTDSHPIITPLPNDDFQVCTKIKYKICHSSLTFTPSFSRDQGSEIIFRVKHPGLEEPIEKSTGPLKLSKHSMNGTVKAQQKASS